MNVKNVSRSYDSGKHYSIKNISFGIKKQECLGLIGEFPTSQTRQLSRSSLIILFLYVSTVQVQMALGNRQFSRFSHEERKCSREQWNVIKT